LANQEHCSASKDRSDVGSRGSETFQKPPKNTFPETQIARFWSLVDRSGGPNACWPWLGLCDEDGYGRFFIGQGERRAHRQALEIKLRRPLAAVEKSLHSCDNPPCCNGEHLFPGSTADNNADCRSKDRHARGERSGAAKLTEVDALAIRVEAAMGGRGVFARIARRYRISSRMASYIATGKRWAHLAGARP